MYVYNIYDMITKNLYIIHEHKTSTERKKKERWILMIAKHCEDKVPLKKVILC